MATHRVVALALERLVLLDLAAPAHVFGHWGGDRYSFVVAGVEPAPMVTSSGFAVEVQAGLEALRKAEILEVSDGSIDAIARDRGFTDAARRAVSGASPHPRSRVGGSVLPDSRAIGAIGAQAFRPGRPA
jgi:hypothetical protein